MFHLTCRTATCLSRSAYLTRCCAGSLPKSWSALNLSTLSLSFNNLIGSIPASWASEGSFGGIWWLDLANNTLTGRTLQKLVHGCCWPWLVSALHNKHPQCVRALLLARYAGFHAQQISHHPPRKVVALFRRYKMRIGNEVH